MPRDLAALAGLGALGYMLANRNKSQDKFPDVDTSGVSDVDLTGGARSMTPDTGELLDETGAMSRLRRNTETGDLYSPDEPITRPSASSVASVQKAVRTPKMASQQFPMTKAPEYKPSEQKTSPAKRETYRDFSGKVQYKKPKETPVETPKSTARYVRGMRLPDRENVKEEQEYLGSAMKRGGKVVKMAKGGMTSSASSRGDGIAQRGKTRGTMVMCGGGYMKGKK